MAHVTVLKLAESGFCLANKFHTLFLQFILLLHLLLQFGNVLYVFFFFKEGQRAGSKGRLLVVAVRDEEHEKANLRI